MSIRFTLKDAAGHEHEYEITALHPGSEGQSLALHFAGLAIEPLITAAGPLLIGSFDAVSGGGKIGVKEIMSAVLDSPEVMDSIDLPAIGAAARRALGSLDAKSIASVLRYTNRDGLPLISDSGRPTGDYDAAFAGNYMELGRAVLEVGQRNGFFPALGTASSAAK